MPSHADLETALKQFFSQLPPVLKELQAMFPDLLAAREHHDAANEAVIMGALQAKLHEITTNDLTWKSDVFANQAADTDQTLWFLKGLVSGFPDLTTTSFELGRTFATPAPDSNQIAFELFFSGANTGRLPNVGRTNRSVKVKAFGVATMEGPKIQGLDTTWNCAHILAQLGVRPHMRADPPHR